MKSHRLLAESSNSSVESLAQPVAAPGVHHYTMPTANCGRSSGSPFSSQSAADLDVNAPESMMGCIGRIPYASPKTTVTKEMHFAMAAQLRKEMDLKVTALANSLVSTLEERLSVTTRHMEDQVERLRSDIAPQLEKDVTKERHLAIAAQLQKEMDLKVTALANSLVSTLEERLSVTTRHMKDQVDRLRSEIAPLLEEEEQMQWQLEDLRKEVCDICDLVKRRQAPVSCSLAFDTASVPTGTNHESVPVAHDGGSRSMPEEDILPRAMRHGLCCDGTVDREVSYVDRQVGTSVPVCDFDPISDDVSGKVLVSEVENSLVELSKEGSVDFETQEFTLVELARQIRVNADCIDVLQHDYQAAKYSIACDCLSLARGTIKDKRELQTIAWTRRGKDGYFASQTIRSSGRLEDATPTFVETTHSYHFHETVWDASVLLFFPHFGWLANSMLLIALTTNILVQCLFCFIVSSLPGDTNDFTNEAVEAFRAWRETASSQVVDVICSTDETVPETNYHAWIMYHDAATYSESTAQIAKSGPVLCVIVLITWTLMICKITRLALDFMEAIHEAADRQSNELIIQLHLSRFTISSVPCIRVAWAYVLGLLQIAIALVLLFVGAQWLVTTTRSSDLVLNAVALTYIMEIDEVMFLTVVPRRIAVVIRNLEPLPCRMSPRMSCERVPFDIPVVSIISFILMTLFVLGMSWASLGDHALQVQRTIDVICGDRV